MGSWNGSTNSFTYPLRAVDFYGSEAETARSIIDISSNVSTSIQKIAFVSSSISITSDSSSVVRKVIDIQPDFQGDVATFIVSLQIADAILYVDIQSDLTVSATKVALASSSLSSTASISVVTKETLLSLSAISIDSSLLVSGTRIKLADASLTSSVEINSVGTRLATIDNSLDVNVDVASSALEVLNANIANVSGSVNSSALATKIAYASAQISVESDVEVSSLKFSSAVSTIQAGSNTGFVIRKITFAQVESIQEAIVFAIASAEFFAKISINIDSRLLVAGMTAFNANRQGEDVRNARTLLVIDDKPLSEHNRKLTSTIIRSFAENRNWSSNRSRYYRTAGARRTFSINWTFLPGEREDTADLRFGRNKIQSIASDPDIHQLKILNFDTDGETPYSEDTYEVIVTNYSENLIRRDISNGVYLWDCSLELEEV